MKILFLILFLSLLGALIGIEGIVFCLTVLLLLPPLYFTYGIFFPSPFVAYVSLIFLISFFLVCYRFFVLKKRNIISTEQLLPLLTSSFVFSLLYTFFYRLCLKWPDFYSLGERMRDLALIGAGLREPILIQEPWMAGFGLNYYAYWYRFAHLLATLLKLQNWEVYHVLVAFAFSFLGISFYTAARQLLNLGIKQSIFLSFLLLLMSNPAGIYYFFLSNITWWYPSRVIAGTIGEFPAWSFLLGDAHPHFLNSGSLLWFVSLSFMAFRSGANPILVVLASVVLPLLFFENANMWEVPIWFAVCGSGFFIFSLSSLLHQQFIKVILSALKKIEIAFFASSLLLCLLSLCFFEMKGNFMPDKYPVKFVTAEVLGSMPIEFFLHWGFFILPVLVIGFLAVKQGRATLFLAILISLFMKTILPFLLILFLVNFLRLLPILKKQIEPDLQILFSEALVFSALALLIVPEIIYLDDPYGADIERMNTFFKISYVNWSLMFFSCAYLLKNYRLEKFSLPCFVLLTSFFFSVIPERSISAMAVEAEENNIERGLSTVENRYPGVKALVEFLSKQASGVVLEAQGPPYSETTLVATLTGFPAYLGWINHVDLLMPAHRDEIQRRNSNLELVYNSPNCQEKLNLLKKEGVSYLVVGELEKKSYPNLSNIDFSCIQPIFQEKNYKLFSIYR